MFKFLKSDACALRYRKFCVFARWRLRWKGDFLIHDNSARGFLNYVKSDISRSREGPFSEGRNGFGADSSRNKIE